MEVVIGHSHSRSRGRGRRYPFLLDELGKPFSAERFSQVGTDGSERKHVLVIDFGEAILTLEEKSIAFSPTHMNEKEKNFMTSERLLVSLFKHFNFASVLIDSFDNDPVADFIIITHNRIAL